MSNPMVMVEDLSKRFGDFTAVDRVSFRVMSGEIFGFLGPNGAGKSTTIRILCGLLSPTSGNGWVAGYNLFTEAEKIKTQIGYMSQKFSLYTDLTVAENIDFYSGIYRIPATKKKERKEWVIEMAGLKSYQNHLTAILPAGWKQRLALGCAILHQPPILFLDEPTAGVDPISRRQFWQLIYQLADQGMTIFVTTHYMDEAEYCDRLGLIYRGELIACATPALLKSETMTDDVVEVICDKPQMAMEALEKLSVVKEIALFGNSIHVITSAGNLSTIAQALKTAGYPIERIEKIMPSLEDLFVSLIKARDREQPGLTEVKQ